MSVELPMWRAIAVFRIATLGYALIRYLTGYQHYAHPVGGWLYMGVLTVWTLATARSFLSAERCRWPLLAADAVVAVTGIVLTRAFDDPARVLAGEATMPTVWAAGTVLGFAAKGGWRAAAAASAVIGAADVVESGAVTTSNVHNIVLLLVAGCAIGWVIELARASESVLARALQLEAANRERERLARDIHDGVLQVLAMVQRRGAELGGEAAVIGRMAGEQEAALRALVSGGLPPDRPLPIGELPAAAGPAGDATAPGGFRGDGSAPLDLRALVGGCAGPGVTVSAPGTPVLLAGGAAAEVAAAVGAALDNVRRHAGEGAHAWILLEDEPDEVIVSIRDDGPGFPPERLRDAEREGRLGVALSIRGRLRDLGGSADVSSVPGQGVEVELRIPRPRGGKDGWT
ncbi:MacS family sensor histidine kinase [Peterkaempfera sp. SMS 1(5)a]|uniref:MacS family sensor histidine kinase n=1 Tax=Peterkaempfera podocarpi TaxID=3232308 RepID=UPI00366DC214